MNNIYQPKKSNSVFDPARKFKWSISAMLFFTIALQWSCKKFEEIPPPINQIVSSEVFSNDQTATSAIIGIYSKIQSTKGALLNGGASEYCGLSSDELVYNSTAVNTLSFQTNTLLPTNSTEATIWDYPYIELGVINACLEGLNNSTSLSSSVKQQLTGEAYFCRALCYFYLTNLFGDVPLVTSTNYSINAVMPRTASAGVYQQIITDLQSAQSLLLTAYPSPGQVRANKWAATALLARVYLYQNNWSKAEAMTTQIIGSGSYSLVSNLNNVFLDGSTEAILQFLPVSANLNSVEGSTFIPSSTTIIPSFSIYPGLLNSFESGDLRKVNWLKSNTIKGVVYYYPYKYKVRSSASIIEDNMILRLAEQYLIRAEARAEQSDVADAVTDLNLIRQRAGLPSIATTISQTACLAAVAQERRIEFFTEFGHRWLDLKRTGQANTVLGGEKSNWNSIDALYPVPQSELITNPFLTQNPGY